VKKGRKRKKRNEVFEDLPLSPQKSRRVRRRRVSLSRKGAREGRSVSGHRVSLTREGRGGGDDNSCALHRTRVSAVEERA